MIKQKNKKRIYTQLLISSISKFNVSVLEFCLKNRFEEDIALSIFR